MPLPIEEVLPAIVDHLRRDPNLVVRAPPGAGKTTLVGPAVLDAGLAGDGKSVLMLEPRRIAARAAARKIARDRGCRLGDEVGYQVRFDDRTSDRTRLAVITEGLLTRRLHTDPCLETVGAVILDEFHERSIHTDLALAFLREIQQTVRPDLRIVVMSATMDPGPVAAFLGGCPVVESQGRLHPVEIHWLDRGGERPLAGRVLAAVLRALEAPDQRGDILVFLPGAREIRQAQAALAGIGDRLEVRPLYGDLPAQEQDRAILPGPRQKIVLATNIAETSLTIEGVTTVVDSGLVKLQFHDPVRGLDRLDTVRISRSSAVQRAGRAGRTGPGRVFELWTKAEEAALPPEHPPEIARVDLAPAVLDVVRFSGRDPRRFCWFEPPPPASVERAVAVLAALGAIDPAAHRLTERGRLLASLPLHPRLASCLVEAHGLGVLEEGALVAALLSERDLLRDGSGDATDRSGPSDVLLRLDLISTGADRIDLDRLGAVTRARNQLVELARRELGSPARRTVDGDGPLLRTLLAGYSDRVCRRRGPGSDRVVMVGGRGARLSCDSVVRQAALLVAVDLEDSRTEPEGLIRIASAVEEAWLVEDTRWVVDEVVVQFDEEREAAEAVVRRRYLDLVIGQHNAPSPDPDALSQCLLDRALAAPGRALHPDDAALGLIGRIEFLRRVMPQLGLPDLGEGGLASLLPELCRGRRSFAQLRQVDLALAIRALLGRSLAALDRHAPERLEVPSGSRVRLRYETGGPPILSVRLQEVFGLDRTPLVAGGTVPVKMELLGPNMRPVQITQDLESFWRTTYPQVRKDLKGRYPKHAWPEDPHTAVPRRRPARRR